MRPEPLKSKSSPFFWMALGLVYLPFLILMIYNHPSVDDFDYAVKAMQLGFRDAQVFWYQEWQGRYTSAAMLSLNPITIHAFFLYKCVPLVLLAGLCHALYALGRALAGPQMARTQLAAAVLFVVAVYLAKMPSVVQGFYWYAAAMTYQLINILMIYLWVCVLAMKRERRGSRRALWLGISTLLTAAIVGGNETAMLLTWGVLLCAFVWNSWHARRVDWELFILLIMASIGAFIVATAPGNAVRLAFYCPPHPPLIKALAMCLANDVKLFFHWVVTPATAALIILAVGPVAEIARQRINAGKKTIHPLWALCGLGAFVTAGFFPGFWSLGGLPPERTINTIFLFFMVGLLFTVYVLTAHVMARQGRTIAPLPKYAQVLLIAFVFLSFMKEDSGVRTAYKNLISGKAARYDRHMTARYAHLKQCGDRCVVDAIASPPATLYFDDITEDPHDWRNRSYAQYFHKKSIVAKK